MKQLSSILNYVLIIVIGVSIGIFFFGMKKEKRNESAELNVIEQSSESGRKSDELVNQFLKELDSRKRIEEAKAYKDIRSHVNPTALSGQKIEKVDDFSQDSLERSISSNQAATAGFDPAQFNGSINASNAAEFIRSARQSGYDIKLNEKFEVISIQPISRRNTNDSHEVYPSE